MALRTSLHSAPALAHAMLVKAEPPRRAQLTQPPAQVRLWFNEEVEKDYASLAVSHGDNLLPRQARGERRRPQIHPAALAGAVPREIHRQVPGAVGGRPRG